jgi:predicted esterase
MSNTTTTTTTTATTANNDKKKRTCLCFHGFSQNGVVFRQRTGSVRTKRLKREYDFVFVNAPHRVDGVFDDDDEWEGKKEEESNDENKNEGGRTEEKGGGGGDARSWWLAGENVESGVSKASDRTWVRPAKSQKIVSWEESAKAIEDAVKENEGRVDAFVGFSQGATLIAILKRVKPEIFAGVKRVVSVAGFDPLDARFYDSEAKIDVPSMHVHGKNDALVTRDRSDRLREQFYDADKAIVFEHDGGHGVPTSKEFREAFETFLSIPPDERD